jgi:uncharacterized protein (DUF736 family)
VKAIASLRKLVRQHAHSGRWRLEDSSFNAPIYANLFNDEDGETFTLIWSRGRERDAD